MPQEQLPQLLATLSAGYAQLAQSPAQVDRLFETSRSLLQQSRAVEPSTADAGALKRPLLDLAQRLVEFNSLLSASLEAASAPPQSQVLHTYQFKAACVSLQAVGALGTQLTAQLSPTEAISLAAPCQLLFECGTAIVQRQREVARLALAAPLADPQEAPRREREVRQEQRSFVALQLAAACNLITHLLSVDNQPRAAAAFGAATARPAALLPWLGTMAAALLESTDGAAAAEEATLVGFATLVNTLLTEQEWSKHKAALVGAADSTAADAVVRVLLERCLPALAACSAAGTLLPSPLASAAQQGFSAALLAVAVPPLTVPEQGLQAAVWRRMQLPVSAAAVRHAAAIVAGLPAQRPAGMDAEDFTTFHCYGMQLLGVLSMCSHQPLTGIFPPEDLPGAQSNGSRSNISASSGGNLAAQQAAGLASVEVFPHAAVVIRGMVADNECSQATIANYCANSASIMSVLGTLKQRGQQGVASPAQLGAWVAASEAGVRLQPLLAQLDAEWKQELRQDDLRAKAAERLSREVLKHLWHNVPEVELQAGEGDEMGEEEQTAQHALAMRLWQLHSASCRLLHWLAADPGHRLASYGELDPGNCLLLQRGLHGILLRALELMPGQEEELVDDDEEEEWEGDLPLLPAPEFVAMCAAHMEVLEATAAFSESIVVECCGDLSCPSRPTTYAQAVVDAMLAVAWACPLVAGLPSFMQPLRQALLRELTGGRMPAAFRSSLLRRLCEAAKGEPRLGVGMASSGLLWEAVRTAKEAGRWREDATPAMSSAVVMLRAAQRAASQCFGILSTVTDSGALGRGSPAEVGRRLQAATDLLERHLHNQEDRDLTNFLQAAEATASLMQEFYALPTPRTIRADMLAMTAADRSCAYLRCSNVELEGGPAAGQGRGCKRCGACRTAWYCGTACSHADWRAARHKAVCKELAADREQQRACSN